MSRTAVIQGLSWKRFHRRCSKVIHRRWKRFHALAAAALLVGCATPQSPDAWVTAQIGDDKPPAYRAGWKDGCSSGTADAGHPENRFRKDVERFAADPLYAQGWDDGQRSCFRQQAERNANLRAFRSSMF